MMHSCRCVMLAVGMLATVGWTDRPVLRADDNKGTIVDLDGLKSRTPTEWKEEAPANRMRLAQFLLPKAKDDKFDAELVIFKGIGGSNKDNIDRWKKMFVPPQGKTLDDISKVKEMKVGGAMLTYLDIEGTYLFKARPFDPNAKAEPRPDSRMLGVVFETKDNPYHIRAVGPAKTIAQYQKGFDEWLKNFK